MGMVSASASASAPAAREKLARAGLGLECGPDQPRTQFVRARSDSTAKEMSMARGAFTCLDVWVW